MSNRYDASDSPEGQFQPGSNEQVLLNKLNITNPEEMDDIELLLLMQLYDEIPQTVTQDQQITWNHLSAWHYRWLGNVYPWAGKIRSVNLGKGDFQFAAVSQLPRLVEIFERQFLSVYTPCIDMDEEALITAIATVHIELILIHPFREGNGRMARLLANVMAMQANQPELDFSFWDNNKAEYFAAVQAGLDDYEPMKTLVRQVLQDTLRNADE